MSTGKIGYGKETFASLLDVKKEVENANIMFSCIKHWYERVS